jgi:hypothetical protein
MKAALRTVAAMVLALAVLAASVWLIYQFDLVYSGAWGIAPLIAGATALCLGLAWALDWRREKVVVNAFVAVAALAASALAGFWVWLLTACALGDCL